MLCLWRAQGHVQEGQQMIGQVHVCCDLDAYLHRRTWQVRTGQATQSTAELTLHDCCHTSVCSGNPSLIFSEVLLASWLCTHCRDAYRPATDIGGTPSILKYGRKVAHTFSRVRMAVQYSGALRPASPEGPLATALGASPGGLPALWRSVITWLLLPSRPCTSACSGVGFCAGWLPLTCRPTGGVPGGA